MKLNSRDDLVRAVRENEDFDFEPEQQIVFIRSIITDLKSDEYYPPEQLIDELHALAVAVLVHSLKAEPETYARTADGRWGLREKVLS